MPLSTHDLVCCTTHAARCLLWAIALKHTTRSAPISRCRPSYGTSEQVALAHGVQHMPAWHMPPQHMPHTYTTGYATRGIPHRVYGPHNGTCHAIAAHHSMQAAGYITLCMSHSTLLGACYMTQHSMCTAPCTVQWAPHSASLGAPLGACHLAHYPAHRSVHTARHTARCMLLSAQLSILLGACADTSRHAWACTSEYRHAAACVAVHQHVMVWRDSGGCRAVLYSAAR